MCSPSPCLPALFVTVFSSIISMFSLSSPLWLSLFPFFLFSNRFCSICMCCRITLNGMKVSRPDVRIGRYRMIKHERDKHNEPNPQRYCIIVWSRSPALYSDRSRCFCFTATRFRRVFLNFSFQFERIMIAWHCRSHQWHGFIINVSYSAIYCSEMWGSVMGSSGSPVHCCRPHYPLSLCPVLQDLNVKDTLTFNQRCLNEDLTFIFSSF